jgi:hypothetical protein
VFSTSVKFLERLFMEQYCVSMLVEYFFENLHGNQVMIDGFTSLFVNGCEFKLIISNLVVFCLEGNTDFQKLVFNFIQYLFYFNWNFAVVVIRKLLILGSDFTHQSSAGMNEVRSQ